MRRRRCLAVRRRMGADMVFGAVAIIPGSIASRLYSHQPAVGNCLFHRREHVQRGVAEYQKVWSAVRTVNRITCGRITRLAQSRLQSREVPARGEPHDSDPVGRNPEFPGSGPDEPNGPLGIKQGYRHRVFRADTIFKNEGRHASEANQSATSRPSSPDAKPR
jgi:hypothetical protein